MSKGMEQSSLDPEFEQEAVPKDYRKSLGSIVAVWFGFPMQLFSAVFGGTVVAQLGFVNGAFSMLLGNLGLFIFVGFLSYRAGETGLNFNLLAKESFGKRGYYLVSGLLAIVVIGWFAVNVGLTGEMMRNTFGYNEILMIIVGGLIYIVITFMGIKALSVLGWIAAPLYVVLSIVAIVFAVKSGVTGILEYKPVSSSAGAITMGMVASMVFAGFADSGTMTADFTRWSKNGKEAVLASITAFPVGNFVAQIVGGIVVATGVIPNAVTNGGNILMVLTGHGSFLSLVSVLFVFISLGSVCTHCLYNGAIGWSHMTGKGMRSISVILGVIGIIAALSGIWGKLPEWFNLLGILVPPIGTIMIMDQIIFRKTHKSASERSWRPLAFVTWIIASGVSLFINFNAPQLSVAIMSVVATVIVYLICKVIVQRNASLVFEDSDKSVHSGD
ncbi:purine-cytosine permease family protein [Bacillus salipaludis]|uniref:purine-cytosine permease family protein n=1 Tax=Bacillus salipaludis TaxID=2547811 RepID=UPI002E1BE8E3|nr:cytosine permease [Bacillus salipaludis]